ncbi:hypothetical protein DFH08DRAFT_802558 [Mycena albidolilacea]|uniref:Uncharacterized protein n=1 Tax=Mycena albidolilacea TaxID=1033008 RepID=A0AAD7EY43_9AGAR|nr:hypothetical protein DFH08DRAFT_802558 [Mycena albidolilacea]
MHFIPQAYLGPLSDPDWESVFDSTEVGYVHNNKAVYIGRWMSRQYYLDNKRGSDQIKDARMSQSIRTLQHEAYRLVLMPSIVEPPLPEVMAQWICLNKGYGAFAGLKVLSVMLVDNASPVVIWLEHFLAEKDDPGSRGRI